MSTPHTHTDETGKLINCYHQAKSVLTSPGFYIGVTLSFPLEHLIWRLWPLSIVSTWLGI